MPEELDENEQEKARLRADLEAQERGLAETRKELETLWQRFRDGEVEAGADLRPQGIMRLESHINAYESNIRIIKRQLGESEESD